MEIAGNCISSDPEIMKIIPETNIHFSWPKENLAIKMSNVPMRLSRNGP